MLPMSSLLALKKEIIGNYSTDNYSQWKPDLRHAVVLMYKQQVAKNPIFPTKKVNKKSRKTKKTGKKNKTKSPKENPETCLPVN